MAQNEELSPVKRALLEMREMRTRLDELEAERTEPIAIVGMGIRFPGDADSPDSFWQLLHDGGDAIGPIPDSRWDINAYFDADYTAPGKMYTRGGGFLKDIDRFDAPFFGISPREAVSMDPQQRLLVEVAWEALERAGQSPADLYNSPTGVFLSMGNSDYARMVWADVDNIDVYYATGTAFSVAAGRLSYLLGLQGPSMTLDTACSGSLVAVHLACQSLRTGESHLALAGGVNLILSPQANINFSKAQMLAPDDHCKTFDAAANGYVRSEGCGMVVLKRLSDAIENGDHIYAVIRGSAVNQDGRSSGLTAPNGPSQESVIRTALANAGVEPDELAYVETHGTGTSLGDPIEVQALGAVFSEGRTPDNRLKIGSVKTNIGHLEAAAGIAGLIKAALSLYHEAIPPHLNLTELSPHMDWANLSIDVPTALVPFPRGEQPRLVGISSFGFSGTNAHVVLEEAPLPEPVEQEVERSLHVLALSAKTRSALRTRAEQMIAYLNENPTANFADALYTANTGRSHFEHRVAISAAQPEELQTRLSAWLDGQEADGVRDGLVTEAREAAFLFSGQGGQYIDMGRQLYETQPLFRSIMDECAALLADVLPQPLLSVIYPEAGAEQLLEQMAYAQPAIFSIEYALARVWQSWGVEPTAVLGHSVGEYAAACIAGVFSLADGLKLVAARGRLMDGLAETGEMVAVFADQARVAPFITSYADRVAIAAVNAPGNVVISGEAGALAEIIAALKGEGIRSRRLAVTQASHSPLMEPMLDEFEAIAKTVEFRRPRIVYISALTGALVGAKEIATPAYWRRHSRETVLFSTALEALYEEGYRVFVEIGPSPTLLPNARRVLPQDDCRWLPSLREGWDDWMQMLESLGGLYTAGVRIDWNGFDADYIRYKLPLPVYPWEGGRYWITQQTAQPTQPLWESVLEVGGRQAQQAPLSLDVRNYPAKLDALGRLAQFYIVQALREWGVFVRPGERHTVAELLERLGIEATYDHLLTRWLDNLSDAGLIQRGDGFYTNRAPLPALDADAVYHETQTILSDVQPLLDYVDRCGRNLIAVLTGQTSPLETLFPNGSYATVDYLYHEYPAAVYMNNIVATVVKAAVDTAGSRTLRVLEVGAGTGGTTATVLPALPKGRVSYQFTDVSDFFLARAQQRFEAYPFVHYGILNLEDDPQAQGYEAGSVDVIIGANVLHATRNLDQTLQHVRTLLAPGGLLVLYETTDHASWYDITTGLIEGWQLFEDDWRGDNPLLSDTRWLEALATNGFEQSIAFPGSELATAVLAQHIIVAQNPGGGAGLGTSARPDVVEMIATGEAADEAAWANEAAANLMAELEALPPDDQLDLLVDVVRDHVRRVLRLDAAQPLDRRDRLMEIGFDSLMAVELRSRLTAALALAENLPSTLMFDYPTPEAIAGYLQRLLGLGETVEEPTPAQPASAPAEDDSDIQELTDEEVEAMLLKKLKDIQ
ncbi:MAG: acyltransferase domain-containing protein [Anaerolineae bacterium]|nr:acyltransferase domain-containing protein [Anaerolineae bacterium]